MACAILCPMERKLPQLPPDVELLNPDDPIWQKEDGSFGPWKVVRLWCAYRVDVFRVEIGWTFGLRIGDFREPDQLKIKADSDWLAEKHDQTANTSQEVTLGLGGLTTKVLRKLPTSHARALMRDRYESLGVAEVKKLLSPLPTRVVEDHEYVHIASAYVAIASTSLEPVRRLAEWTQESVDTWFARLKRARARGILEGTGQNARICAKFQEASAHLWKVKREEDAARHGS